MLGLWSLEGTLLVDILSELLPLSTQLPLATLSLNPVLLTLAAAAASFFFNPELPSPATGLDKLLDPNAEPLSPLNPKKLSCGSGPDLVFILFNPSDDARMGDTDAGSVAGDADDDDFFGVVVELKPAKPDLIGVFG